MLEDEDVTFREPPLHELFHNSGVFGIPVPQGELPQHARAANVRTFWTFGRLHLVWTVHRTLHF